METSFSLDEISRNSKELINKLRTNIEEAFKEDLYKHTVIYVCGSLSRGEMLSVSDLDLFFIDTHHNKSDGISKSNIRTYDFFSKLYKINQEYGFQEPSKDGLYWRFMSRECLFDIGSSTEDYNNGFTARMLLILESTPLFNSKQYNKIIHDVINKYFEEYENHRDNFYPLFLINDILRYWYTLTLNYEYHRDGKDDVYKKNWRRLKLKFARLLTCFSFVGCLCMESTDPKKVIQLTKLSPLEKLDFIAKKRPELCGTIEKIQQEYLYFIGLHRYDSTWWTNGSNKEQAFEHADTFHRLLIQELIGKLLIDSPIRDKLELISII